VGSEIAQVMEARLHPAELLLVELARGFLAVAGEEGNGVARVEEFGDGLAWAGRRWSSEAMIAVMSMVTPPL